jgi:hypothetical protein
MIGSGFMGVSSESSLALFDRRSQGAGKVDIHRGHTKQLIPTTAAIELTIFQKQGEAPDDATHQTLLASPGRATVFADKVYWVFASAIMTRLTHSGTT